MRGPMLTIVLLAVFIIVLYYFLASLAFLNDLTGLPVYLLLPMSPVYLIGVYFFWTYAKESYQERKFKKLTALFLIVFLAFASPITAILAAVPNWSLTATTDKNVYRLGENVTIIATLTNNAYFGKPLNSFELSLTSGIIPRQHVFVDEFVNISSVGPRQSLKQTLTCQANGTEEYYVRADIFSGINEFFLSYEVNITITP